MIIDHTNIPRVRWAVGSMGPSVEVYATATNFTRVEPLDLDQPVEVESFLESWTGDWGVWRGVAYIDNQTHERILTKNLRKYSHIWKALAEK